MGRLEEVRRHGKWRQQEPQLRHIQTAPGSAASRMGKKGEAQQFARQGAQEGLSPPTGSRGQVVVKRPLRRNLGMVTTQWGLMPSSVARKGVATQTKTYNCPGLRLQGEPEPGTVIGQK